MSNSQVEVMLLHHTPRLSKCSMSSWKRLVRFYISASSFALMHPLVCFISSMVTLHILTPINSVQLVAIKVLLPFHYPLLHAASKPLSLTWESSLASLPSLLVTHKTISYGLWQTFISTHYSLLNWHQICNQKTSQEVFKTTTIFPSVDHLPSTCLESSKL